MKIYLTKGIILLMLLVTFSCSNDDEQPQTPPVVNKVPEISAQTFTTAEDIADDTVIGKVVATDPENKALTFTLTKNSDALFELTDTGELSLVADKKLDFETTTTYTLSVEVSDGTHKASADITITVENVSEPFITTWKTTQANEEITIGINEEFTYNFTIDWGDGTVENNQTTPPSHTYTTADTYTVSISGEFPGIYMNFSGNYGELQTIEQWGDNEWESFHKAFAGCTNLTYNTEDVPDLSKVTDVSRMFDSCTKFNADLDNWDVSTITDMSSMFSSAKTFNGNVSNWDVSSVTRMGGVFRQTNFTGDLSKWDVSNVVHMPGVFAYSPFNGDLSKWNVSKVTRIYEMFRGSSFAGDISDWDIQKVTDMGGMLTDSSISEANYDKLLTKWAALPNLQSNVTLGAEGLTYCDAGKAGRTSLINDKGWTITGDTSCPQ